MSLDAATAYISHSTIDALTTVVAWRAKSAFVDCLSICLDFVRDALRIAAQATGYCSYRLTCAKRLLNLFSFR
jgi:hypothetical protein